MLRSMRQDVFLLAVALTACSPRRASLPLLTPKALASAAPLAPPPAPAVEAELLPESASQITFEDMARFPEPGW
jgi:hypothetical protein